MSKIKMRVLAETDDKLEESGRWIEVEMKERWRFSGSMVLVLEFATSSFCLLVKSPRLQELLSILTP